MSSKSRMQIKRGNLVEAGVGAATIESVKHLASYSWIESSVPTIAVPGIPPRWSPPTFPTRLKKDSGLVYIAQNAARHPEIPLEPLFRSIEVASPEFDVRSSEVITDRNNIRKLLGFINSSSSQNGPESFTIVAEMVKNTLIMARTEAETSQVIQPYEFIGYSHEFEKAYTRCQLADSTGYHRIVSYTFGGLNFTVRHEVDGYVPSSVSSTSNGKETKTDDLAGLLESLSLSATDQASSVVRMTRPPGSKMIIREEGFDVPLDSNLEIKTRVSHKRLGFSDIAPQLWALQTPKLVRAQHNRGVAALVKKILDAVRACGGEAIVRYEESSDKINVLPKVNGKRLLPEDLYLKWNRETANTKQDLVEASPHHPTTASKGIP
ncbi:geranylgeranyl pyrophosphate synthetase [Xylaria arbuscula]|nr:geranylgeranyl pyrophosphate synthetase [Xylaria arbuscula]